MINNKHLNPEEWTKVIELFNDAQYSAIWGKYNGRKCLAIRWNKNIDNDEPLWHLEPQFLTEAILLELLKKTNNKKFRKNIYIALKGNGRAIHKDSTTISNAERKMITSAMILAKGSKAKAAKALGIHRATLYTKIKKYNMKF